MAAAAALPVIIRRRSPQDIAGRAHQVLHAAIAIDWPASRAAWREVAFAAIALDRELDEYQALESGTVGWEAAYPELADAEDPHAEALGKAAEECALAMALLLMTIAACCGTEVADQIAAITGGTPGGEK